MSHFTDAALIARVLAGDDRHAFGELVRRYQSMVRGFLRKLVAGDTQLADELAQDVFVKAYRGISSYRGTAQFSTWLCRIAYNVFVSSKRQSKMIEYQADMDQQAGEQISPHDNQILARRDIQKMSQGLSSVQRAALILSYGYQLSHDDIAAVLSLPLGTVKSHIARGREKMRENFSTHKQEQPA